MGDLVRTREGAWQRKTHHVYACMTHETTHDHSAHWPDVGQLDHVLRLLGGLRDAARGLSLSKGRVLGRRLALL